MPSANRSDHSASSSAASPLASSARRRLGQLLALVTLAPAALLGLGLMQSSQEVQMARDINRGGSLRYRTVYIYSLTHLDQTEANRVGASRAWQDVWGEMLAIREELRERYPKQVQDTDKAWRAYSDALMSRGKPDWIATQVLLMRADEMTNDIDTAAQARAARTKRWFSFGILGLGFSLPVAALIFGQLRGAQRRAAQQNEALQAAVMRFQSLFDNIPMPCFSYDCDGRITNWNWSAGLTFDRSLSQVKDKPLWEVLSYPERWEGAKEMVAQVCRGEELSEFEWSHPHRDGRERHFLSSVFPLRDASGTIIGGLAANVDMTSRREATEKLQAASRELSRSNSALQDFAYVASHDLKEPLRKIQTFGGMLQRRMKDAPTEQTEQLERILSAATRMQTLIEGLMEYSRVTTRGREPTQVVLSTTLKEVLSDLEARIAETGGTVVVDPLPSVCADPVQMRQLFQNLVGNALKFHAPDRPVRVRVWASANAEGNCAQITVQDNGIGFDPKYAERIFEVFERLEGRHRYEGTGIGLAICRKIVERHGGSIVASAVPGEGATFTLVLPIITGSLVQNTGTDDKKVIATV